MFDIPIGADRKKIRKEINDIFSEARQKGKPERCILCGEVQTSLCNSHSVPKMSLKAIADNGMLLHASAAIGLNMEVVNLEDGINRSGTFNYICRKCDSSFFQDYENLNSLIAYDHRRPQTAFERQRVHSRCFGWWQIFYCKE